MPKTRRRRQAGAPARLHAARRRIAGPVMRTSPPELEAVVEKDRAFFRAFPNRTTRMRLSEPAEIEAAARAGQVLGEPQPGFRWVTVVHQVAPGGRIRRYCQWANDVPLDPPDALCLDLFRYLAGDPNTVIGGLMAEQMGSLH